MLSVARAHDWKRAEPGWRYEFPRDEYSHPDFKTEWWYFTGNLREASTGRRFGYQLTFFRQGLRPPGDRDEAESKFVVDHFWFAHFAVSDLEAEQFYSTQEISRGAFEEAGSDPAKALAWIGEWRLESSAEVPGTYRLVAATEEFSVELQTLPLKPPVFHGKDGVSAKSPEPGNASHYYSLTRLGTTGKLSVKGKTFEVEGLSWYDREWSTSVLSPDQVGWDWFSLQLEDGAELMLFQLRGRDGSKNFASGTWIGKDGAMRELQAADLQFQPLKTWRSPVSQAEYPIQWRVRIPSLKADLTVRAAQANQELNVTPLHYWEGAVLVDGSVKNRPATGRGYLEMTGYASPVTGLGTPVNPSGK